MKLKQLILGAALALATFTGAYASAPKYVFYFIGDGMGFGPVNAAETYLRMNRTPAQSLNMMSMPVKSFIQTYSANRPVTDSAAAGTALSTGTKTKNGMLGMGPDTTAVYSVAQDFKKQGYGIGIVTSVAPDDATPGAFYAHVPYRGQYYDVDVRASECDYEFLAGAGLRGLKDKKGNATDVLDRMARNNVQIIWGPDEIEKISSRKVLLLNPKDTDNNNIGYTIDSIQGVLNLPLITRTCLDHLLRYTPDKFFMMVEGGNIDHALHANDAGAAIKEIINFDEALGIALDFYREHPDETLIIVTADHNTGGLEMGNPYVSYNARLGLIDAQRLSKPNFEQFCETLLKSRRTYKWEDMKEELQNSLGLFTVVPVSETDEAKLKDIFDETFERREGKTEKTLYDTFSQFAVEVFKIIDKATGLAFTTDSHSGNPVPLFVIGDDADQFKGIGNNDQIAPLLRKLLEEN